MISNTTKVVNNKFQVTFNFAPKDIVHSRTNSKGTYTATHKGGGTTQRKGIWEGIEIIDVQTKIGSNAWRSHGAKTSVTVETSDNGVTVQAWAKYRLKTMGWHWNDFSGTYPFFWFGNVGGVDHKYKLGSFRDTNPKTPGSEHNICAVPPDWKYVSCQWSDWAYKHAQDTPNWHFSNGRYEQRNGNYEAAKATNGWISDSGYKQMWRKSMMFNFEKEYSTSVKSSGISTHPNTPTLTVHGAKGDSGKITVKYTDNAGVAGKLWINAYCNGKTAQVLNYDNSWTFSNGESRTIDVNFVNAFGEESRGNDVHYEAWSKNNLGYECKSSTGWKGVQRYNGRPSIPTGLSVTGSDVDAIVYDYVNFSWNKSTDPDNDSLTYDIWLRVIEPSGKVLKDAIVKSNISSLYINKYDINNVPDSSKMEVWVRAYDGLLYSDWSSSVKFEKGAVPTGALALIAPSKSGSLYNTRPRFTFGGYDGKSTFVVMYNNTEYNTDKDHWMFTKSEDKVMFKPDFDIPKNEEFKIYAHMRNEYGNSKKSPTYKFTVKDAYENITEGEIILASNVKQIQTLIADFGKVYNKTFEYTKAVKNGIVLAQTFNECRNFLNEINNYINDLIPNNVFDYNFWSKEVSKGDINDDMLWDNLIKEMKDI